MDVDIGELLAKATWSGSSEVTEPVKETQQV
jgi:hypothetical protein